MQDLFFGKGSEWRTSWGKAQRAASFIVTARFPGLSRITEKDFTESVLNSRVQFFNVSDGSLGIDQIVSHPPKTSL